MPFVSATSIIASESFFQVLYSLGPLYLLITRRSTGFQLRGTRKALQRDVRELADKHGWTDIIAKSRSQNTSLGDLSKLA